MNTVKEKKGFTLAELLVVVAIIGILVAVSIPIFSGQRQKAIDATNKANIRAAKAAAYADYLSVGNTQLNSFYDYDCQKGAFDIEWNGWYKGKTIAVGDAKLDYWKNILVDFQSELPKNNEIYTYIIVLVTSNGVVTCPYYDDLKKTTLATAFQ